MYGRTSQLDSNRRQRSRGDSFSNEAHAANAARLQPLAVKHWLATSTAEAACTVVWLDDALSVRRPMDRLCSCLSAFVLPEGRSIWRRRTEEEDNEEEEEDEDEDEDEEAGGSATNSAGC